MDILLVDGYNIIGAWPQLQKLKENDFSSARDILIEKMAEYQAYTGFKVMIIFDAHLVQGIEKKYHHAKIDVIYTRENETADERIEKLAIELSNIRTQIHVATSDYTEQWAIFGQGALRKSARELRREVEEIERNITGSLKSIHEKKPTTKITISDEILKKFEKWRRGEQ